MATRKPTAPGAAGKDEPNKETSATSKRASTKTAAASKPGAKKIAARKASAKKTTTRGSSSATQAAAVNELVNGLHQTFGQLQQDGRERERQLAALIEGFDRTVRELHQENARLSRHLEEQSREMDDLRTRLSALEQRLAPRDN